MKLLVLTGAVLVSLLFKVSFCAKSLTDTVVEGNRYRPEKGPCNYKPVKPDNRAKCDKCLSAIDCAVECSLQDFGGEADEVYTKCAGFVVRQQPGSSEFETCILFETLNCTTNKMNSASGKGESFRQTPKKLPPRKLGSKIDAFDPELCGAGNLRELYDPLRKNVGMMGRIIGGNDAEPGEFPFHIMLSANGKPGANDCGGSLIDREWVLTAAHCIPYEAINANKKTISVSLGRYLSYNDKGNYTNVWVGRDGGNNNSSVFIHPRYVKDLPIHGYDFALLRLSSPLTEFSEFISPVCLPQTPVPSYDDKIVLSTGWGMTDWKNHSNSQQSALQKVPRRLLNQDDCLSITEEEGEYEILFESMLCTGRSGHRGQCYGDSGGPWAVVDRPFGKISNADPGSRWTQVGLTSFGGDNCGDTAGIGAKINDEVISWINEITSKPNN